MKLSHLLTAAAAVLISAASYAAIPTGYYTSLTGKKEGELKTAIHDITSKFTKVSSYEALPQYFQKTDVYPDSRRWWDMYSDIPFYAPSFSGLNREHSFPKSWWGGLTDVGAYVDLNHLYPSEMRANTAKSNYPLGEVDRTQNIKFQNGITTVGYPVSGQGGGAQYVFEPADEYKGDFARTYFYMATTYQDLRWRYTYMVNQNLYPTLNTWSINLLMKWHREDPVSQKEIDRNEAVYKIQNNRNPFIDYPALADYLWGNRRGEAFDPGTAPTPGGTPNLITPVQDMALEFGEVALGNSNTAQLFFNGENLSAPLSVRIYRDTDNPGFFTLPGNTNPTSIAASLVNGGDGYWLNVTYKPTALGDHTARILISGGGITGSRGIELRGSCLPVPELGACTAAAATDITADSYTANWTAPEGDVIDYFMVTRTKYLKNGSTEVQYLPAEENSLEIVGFSDSESETYTVSSVRLGVQSPASNVITVNHAGIEGVVADQPLSVYAYEGGIRIFCGTEHTGLNIMDTMGRTVRAMPVVEDGAIVDLPAGIYMLVTDQRHTPVKFIVK